MKIISIIHILTITCCSSCKTVISDSNSIRSGKLNCELEYMSEKGDYVFENRYKVDESICSVNWFKLKDIDGSRKGDFKNGVQDGKWVVEKYHDYDSVGYSKSKRYLGREEYFRNGLRDSIYKIYNNQGKVIYSTKFQKGNGIEKDFYDNGQLYYEIETKDGYFTDTLKLYYPTGELKEKRLYNKDSLIFSKIYDR